MREAIRETENELGKGGERKGGDGGMKNAQGKRKR